MSAIGLTIVKLLLLVNTIMGGDGHVAGDIPSIVKQLNEDLRMELNILINSEGFNSNIMEQLDQTPKLIITDGAYNATPLHKLYTKQSLTLAWITWNNLNNSLDIIERLLWTQHFKDIFLIIASNDTIAVEKNLVDIFQLCWQRGFISTLISLANRLYTYHPYPKLKTVPIDNVIEFEDKTHLNNFHGYLIHLPFIEFPPHCFSYTNRRGKYLRVGYVYQWIEVFFKQHNATFKHHFHDIRSPSTTYKNYGKFLDESGYAMVTFITALTHTDIVETSDTMFLTKSHLMVPAAKEISSSLYLIIPFDNYVWSIVVLTGLLFFLLVNFINFIAKNTLDLGKAFLNAFNIIIFLSVSFNGSKSCVQFYLYLLFLFTGIFLTNFYSTSLSSLYTSKVYEPEIDSLADIAHTNLYIMEHTAEFGIWQNKDIPSIFMQRLRSGNNTEFLRNRQNLNMTYMYTALEELHDFLLFQQYYMKRPIATTTKEPIVFRPMYITVPHRSVLIDQFNRYLQYIRENGLLEKILEDTKWHGVLSGNLRIFLDVEDNKSLTMEYFQYAFIIWIVGLLCALVGFLIENLFKIYSRTTI